MFFYRPFKSLRVDSWFSNGSVISMTGWLSVNDFSKLSLAAINVKTHSREDLVAGTIGVEADFAWDWRLYLRFRLARKSSKLGPVSQTQEGIRDLTAAAHTHGIIESAIQIGSWILVKGWSADSKNALQVGGSITPLLPNRDCQVWFCRKDVNEFLGLERSAICGFEVLLEVPKVTTLSTSYLNLERAGKVLQRFQIQKGPTDKLQIASLALGDSNQKESSEEQFRKISTRILQQFEFVPNENGSQFSVIDFDLSRTLPSPEISIVIPFFGHSEFMRVHFLSLGNLPEKDRDKIEVIIVNDDPAEDLYSLTKLNSYTFSIRAKLVSSTENHGFAGAVWGGACAASGETLIIQNSDCFIEDAKIYRHLAERVQGESNLGSIAPLILREDGSIDHLGMQEIEVHGKSAKFFKHVGAGVPDVFSQDRTTIECRYLTGAFLALRKDLFVNDLGGFPKFSFLGDFEDAALSDLIHSFGYKMYVDRSCRAVHLTRTSFERFDSNFRDRLSWYNATQYQEWKITNCGSDIAVNARFEEEVV